MVKDDSLEKVEFGQRLAEGEGVWVCGERPSSEGRNPKRPLIDLHTGAGADPNKNVEKCLQAKRCLSARSKLRMIQSLL